MRNSLNIWNPTGYEWSSFPRNIDSFFDSFLTPTREENAEWRFNPACDVEETESHYLVSFDLPGVAKENVKIEVENNLLVVSGERKSEHKEKGSKHRVERFHGTFKRAFQLPSMLDTSKIEANYQDGVLRIEIPKTEAAKPRQIKIGEGKGSFMSKLLGKENSEDSTRKAA